MPEDHLRQILVRPTRRFMRSSPTPFDCHSDGGIGPWNAKLAPSYLFGTHKAQEVLNFSNWPALDTKQRSAIAAEITSVVANGSMPPGDYGFLHPSAKLNDEQKSIVLQWARKQTALAAH